MLPISNQYCIVCNEVIDNLCEDCCRDKNVVTEYYIKNLYRLTLNDIDNIPRVKYGHFLANAFEEAVLLKYSGIDGAKVNKSMIDRINKNRSERLNYRTKYVEIREELSSIFNKLFDQDAKYIDMKQLKSMIHGCIINNYETFAAAYKIYDEFKDGLPLLIETNKIKELCDNKTKELFPDNYTTLFDNSMYQNTVKTLKTLEDASAFMNESSTQIKFQYELDKHERNDKIQKYIANNVGWIYKSICEPIVVSYVNGDVTYEVCVETIVDTCKKRDRTNSLVRMVDTVKYSISPWFYRNFGEEVTEFCKELPDAQSYINGTYPKTNATLKKYLKKHIIERFSQVVKRRILNNNFSKCSNNQEFYDILMCDNMINEYLDEKVMPHSEALPDNILARMNLLYKNYKLSKTTNVN
jgi:hypothetical protein